MTEKEKYEQQHPEFTYPAEQREPSPQGERIIVRTGRFRIDPGREGQGWTEIIIAPKVKPPTPDL